MAITSEDRKIIDEMNDYIRRQHEEEEKEGLEQLRKIREEIERKNKETD